MAYGMKIYNTDNTLAYDSTSPGGVFLRFVVLAPGTTTGVLYYEDLGSAYISKSILLYPLVLGDHSFSIIQGNVSSGQNPVIAWQNTSQTPSGADARKQTIIMVFAK